MNFNVNSIGTIHCDESGFYIELKPEYKAGLQGLSGYDYIMLLYWCDGCDNAASRSFVTAEKPYTKGPDRVGVFATRSPARPNPIAVSTAYVTHIEAESGIVHIAWTDALDNTPLLDIKPYTPSVDRVESPAVPDWCAHWPNSVETSGDFDWESEFNF